MNSDKKVLTVSYGAFSCTLEGFEDSIGTMKAVAEYFRDLAAEDRDFGAQRLQADTDTISRIAEAESAVQVEAFETETGIHLRAAEVDSLEEVSMSPLGDDFDDAPFGETPPEGYFVRGGAESDDDFGMEDDLDEPAETDSIADKLQRIRAVVSQSDDPAAEYSEDEHAEIVAEDASAVRIDEIDQFFGPDATSSAEDFDELLEDSGNPVDFVPATDNVTVHEPGETYEDELDRLMAEADSHMGEPESSSRRDDFDRLRGVVAATMADDELNSDEGATEDPYRTDLAAAVTPRRPVATGSTERPRDQRPAPLTLVAEQRVDLPSSEAGPVRPRRVASPSVPETGEDNRGFIDYAKAQGADDLPDLMEAAAAYLGLVEGRDQFTRPQLMAKIRQIDPGRFSREDSLRQFGVLLRTGKIEKVGEGQFTVSEDIGFRPDGNREAG